ncbi:methyltransferase domain-containing protein [Streptomyces tendae]|uniref:methyltransferase domain-containing protein n=1 Tax=Streptomyces tendae TaxID=1932 RepID=UPI0036B3B701
MYVGSSGVDGTHHLVFELVDNAVDEAQAGFCRRLTVTVHADGSCSIEDDGRGVPVDPHPSSGRPTAEVLLTTLHSGGKFGGHAYRTSAGLHGVGMSVVNALSSWLRIDVWRGGVHYQQSFKTGLPVADKQDTVPGDRHGTRIRFHPDDRVLGDIEIVTDRVRQRLEELACLHADLRVELRDERAGTSQVLPADGIQGLLARRTAGDVQVHPGEIEISADADTMTMSAAVRWTEAYTEEYWSFVNSVPTPQGGSHVDGLRTGLAAAVRRYAIGNGLLDAVTAARLTTVDMLEGLRAVLTVQLDRPEFDGQTKRRLQKPEAVAFVHDAVEAQTLRQFTESPELAAAIVGRILDANRARMAARLAGRTARYKRREVDIDYEAYQRQFGIRSRNWHDSCSWLTDEGLLARHAELCDVGEDARMLDVCCGSGVVGNAFRGRVGEMVGLDITPEMVDLARTRLDKVYQGNVYDLPFEDASFDLVVNREVLHLLPQPERPLSEIYRVLRPGGQFIVGQIVPYTDEDAYWMYRIFKKKQPLLCQMFSDQDMRDLLLGAGFRDLRVEEYFLWESIDRWIDTHETTPANRRQIHQLFHEAPPEVRAVHPFEIASDGSIQDRWRWCVYALRKPLA